MKRIITFLFIFFWINWGFSQYLSDGKEVDNESKKKYKYLYQHKFIDVDIQVRCYIRIYILTDKFNYIIILNRDNDNVHKEFFLHNSIQNFNYDVCKHLCRDDIMEKCDESRKNISEIGSL